MGRYLSILSRPSAVFPFVAAVIARLPISMAPLGMVLLIQEVRGEYAIAGLVTAVFALGVAVSAPGWGRLMDRRGQPLVIGPMSLVCAGLLTMLSLTAADDGSDLVLVVLAAGVGLSFPPISPAMRGAWRAALDSETDRQAAYALDAVAVETIFVGGPLLLSVLLAVAEPVVPLLVTAALLALGGGSYALTGAARAWRPEQAVGGSGQRGASPLTVRGIQIVLGVASVVAVGFGLQDVALAATARLDLGDQTLVGLLFASIAGGSAVGGLWYGSRAWRRPEHVRLPVSLGGFALGLAAVTALLATGRAGLPALVPVLFLTGLCIAPSLIVLGNLIDHHGANDRLAEAQGWLNTAFTSGGAIGTALAGVAVDTGGAVRGFAVAMLAVALAGAAALGAASVWRRDRTSALSSEPSSEPRSELSSELA